MIEYGFTWVISLCMMEEAPIPPLLDSPCCIVHTFERVAALNPQKIAVVHASPAISVHHSEESLHSRLKNGTCVDALAAHEDGVCSGAKGLQDISKTIVANTNELLVHSEDIPYSFEELQGAVVSLARLLTVVLGKEEEGSVGYTAGKHDVSSLDTSSSSNEGFVKTAARETLYEVERVCATRQTNFCYILHTSGSSGTPKGVCGTEEGLINRLSWMESAYPHVNTDVGCFKTSVGFVDHLTEALGPLLAGIPIIIPSPEILKENLLILLNYIQTYKITRLTAVPSIFRALLPALKSTCRNAADSLRILSLSGESLSLKLQQELHCVLENTTILNLYGSTEVSGDSSCFDCTSLWDASSTSIQLLEDSRLSTTPIGDPINGCYHFIVVDGEKLGGVNEEGELWVGGVGVAQSYLNDNESTREKFIDLSSQNDESDRTLFLRHIKQLMQPKVLQSQRSKFRGSDASGISRLPPWTSFGERIFRTGDVVKKLPDGNVVLLGRIDRQVKIRGNRISLEEIEGYIEMHPKVSRCVVTLHTRLESDMDLVAYVVYDRAMTSLLDKDHDMLNHRLIYEEITSNLSHELKLWLAEKLPSVMIPQIFIPLVSLPLTNSGKVDYDSLPDLIGSSVEDAKRNSKSAEQTESLGIEHIRQVFTSVLKAEKLSDTDDFFSAGGTSISAAHVAYLLNIDMHLLYMYPSAILLHNAIEDTKEITLGDIVSTQTQGRSYQSSVLTNTENVSRISNTKDPVLPVLKYVDDHEFPRNVNVQGIICESLDQSLLSRKRKLDEAIFESEKATKEDCWTWNSSNQIRLSLSFSRCNRTVNLRALVKAMKSTVEPTLTVHSQTTKVERSMHSCWRVSLQACVDASPLVVFHGEVFRVFIGSHSHSFYSLDATSGKLQWEATLGGRVESSAAVTRDLSQVVVGCYDGFIYFLDFWNGQKLWDFKTGGQVKCQPALDPWTGLIWCGSHDHHIYALDPASHMCVWRHDCGGSIFGAPAFNEGSMTVYFGTTRGTVIAIQIKPTIFVSWTYECGAPIFGSLALDPSTDFVICTSVSGRVIALKPNGVPAWQAKTEGPIFAGATISRVLISQVLVCSGDCHLYCINLQNGSTVWKYNVGGPITSSAYVEEDLVLLQDRSEKHQIMESLICVATTSGTVHVLRAPSAISSRSLVQNKSCFSDPQSPSLFSALNERPSLDKIIFPIQEVTDIKLPGEVFSSPVMISGRIFIGCRDDFLYCLELM
ncbi:putative acyl-activating enzyme 19 isoform X5 [Physcomitrium patens]|uniref:putative acyl-activating enzyme 19 isoform X5 n=1 Tax=Physcomitrium patens TaxID=3218 RepID=UPI000D161D58|nr:putative acyl-activating enzyme 19 isoform X5 [Physcomitrium patens]|eukprot:XP_024385786.1 putative acyl-activating enzyme 19 isoform X5 [Physcomitrella patens]